MHKYFVLAAILAVGGLSPVGAGITMADYEPITIDFSFDHIKPYLEARTPIRTPVKATTIATLSPATAPAVRTVEKSMKVRITAYSSTPEETDDTPFITASGKTVRDGIIAANFLPMGTKVKIPSLFGNKVFTVEDRMHPRMVNVVDVWMPSKSAALKFGVTHNTEIHVLN